MPRTEAANQRRRSAQREKILDAARKVFARKGMAATMGEIAAEASVSHGLAYHYFANKEALFHALVDCGACLKRRGRQGSASLCCL